MPNDASKMGELYFPTTSALILSAHGYVSFLCFKVRTFTAAPVPVYRRWHLRNFAALKAYTATLADETREWVLALFVDVELGLIAVETFAVGSISGARVDSGRIICRGRSLQAAGYFLVHNHPSGDPTPSSADLDVTRRLMREERSAKCHAMPCVVARGDENRWRLVGTDELGPHRAGPLRGRLLPLADATEIISVPNSAVG